MHRWIMSAANTLARQGVGASEAERIIAAAMTRQPSPANEVASAVSKAYREKGERRPIAKVRSEKAQFSPKKLARIAARVDGIDEPGSIAAARCARISARQPVTCRLSFILGSMF